MVVQSFLPSRWSSRRSLRSLPKEKADASHHQQASSPDLHLSARKQDKFVMVISRKPTNCQINYSLLQYSSKMPIAANCSQSTECPPPPKFPPPLAGQFSAPKLLKNLKQLLEGMNSLKSLEILFALGP